MSTAPIPIQAKKGQAFLPEIRSALLAFRSALAEAMASVRADITRPQELSRHLGLDKSLAWHLSRILTADGALEVVPHLPGKSGMRITVRALEEAGATPATVGPLVEAVDRINSAVSRHCGDRATLAMMTGHTNGSNGASRDEAHRKRLFQGMSAVWGVQAQVHVSAQFVAPAQHDSDRIDYATVSGLVGLVRLWSNVPWAVASVHQYSDDGTSLPGHEIEPVDSSVPAGEVPLLRDFCSDDLPDLSVAPGPQHVRRYELRDGAVGRTGACTCVTGWINRSIFSPWRTETDRYGEHTLTFATPARLGIFDLFVHRDLPFVMPPEIALYGELPGSPVYPQGGRDRGRLRLAERVIELGAGPPDVTTPELPRYRALVEQVVDRLGGTPRDYAGYRVRIPFPPIPTRLVFRHELPERDDRTGG